jgi:hypothetical protein
MIKIATSKRKTLAEKAKDRNFFYLDLSYNLQVLLPPILQGIQIVNLTIRTRKEGCSSFCP